MADSAQAERIQRDGVAMTFADHLRTHQDATVRTAAQWCRAGPIDLADALRELDAIGAPGVASTAVREAWREFQEARCR